MNIAKRLLGPCARFSGGPETIYVDVGALVRRLLLFDTYILETNRLLEIPRLVEAFGPIGFITLLQSGALKIQCQAFTIGEVGQSGFNEKRRRVGHLPFGSLSLAVLKSADPTLYLHNSLQIVHQADKLPLKQAIKVKKAIIECLENSPEGAGADTIANTLLDVAKPDLLRTALARVGMEATGRDINPDALTVKMEKIDNEDFRIESNLAKITNIDERMAHNMLVGAVLAIAGVNSRIEAMKAHECLSGVIGEDVAFLEKKLACLWREIAQKQEVRFNRVIELTGLPDISIAADKQRIDVDRLLKARQSRECSEFRDWLHHLDEKSDKEVIERVRGFKAIADGLVQSTGGKTVRLVLSAAVGSIPTYGPVLGLIAGALDMFLVDKLFTRKGPAAFISDYYKGLFERDS